MLNILLAMEIASENVEKKLSCLHASAIRFGYMKCGFARIINNKITCLCTEKRCLGESEF